MKPKTYGTRHQPTTNTRLEERLEELAILGYTVVEDVLGAKEVHTAREKLGEAYQQQEAEFGREYLACIHEENIVRCPLAYDEFFLDLATQATIIEIAQAAIGGGYILLHLQNGIINKPNEEHHQSAWHRDLPYQEFVISKPLAISALFCLDDFTIETGGTYVLPCTHRGEKLPSAHYIEKHQTQVTAQAGSVIVFDAMLYHRAGYNASDHARLGVNHVYAVPLLKQQIDLPVLLKGKYSDHPSLSRLLGYTSHVPESVTQYRHHRHSKMYPG